MRRLTYAEWREIVARTPEQERWKLVVGILNDWKASQNDAQPLVDALRDARIWLSGEFGEHNWRVERIDSALGVRSA